MNLYFKLRKYFRTKRMRQFQQIFQIGNGSRIIDIGGYPFNWTLLEVRPQLTILNLHIPEANNELTKTNFIAADGRYLPFRDQAFDIVFSNSVIEHVGSFSDQQLFAQEISRVRISYFVQTPNKRFFFDQHWLLPFIHFLPGRWHKRLVKILPSYKWLNLIDPQIFEQTFNQIRLLDEKELSLLFPDADILTEKLLWMTKSLVALKYRLPDLPI